MTSSVAEVSPCRWYARKRQRRCKSPHLVVGDGGGRRDPGSVRLQGIFIAAASQLGEDGEGVTDGTWGAAHGESMESGDGGRCDGELDAEGACEGEAEARRWEGTPPGQRVEEAALSRRGFLVRRWGVGERGGEAEAQRGAVARVHGSGPFPLLQ